MDETEQTLPPLTDGEMARLAEPRIDAKRTPATRAEIIKGLKKQTLLAAGGTDGCRPALVCSVARRGARARLQILDEIT